ncbi:MAG: hypothetical protein R3B70_28450 [Polyangiaceae bacterium]
MAVNWTDAEYREVAAGIEKYGIHTGMCAALARVVHRIAITGDPGARGVQLRCKKPVRYLVPKKPHVPYWGAHTYVETREHAVDSVTGPNGYQAASYVDDHWYWNDRLYEQVEIDVTTVDPGIEDIGDDS